MKKKSANLPSSTDIYLGQKSPGLNPELFAADIINTQYREAAAAISHDLKEFYFRRRGGLFKKNALVVVKYENNQWSESLIDSTSGEPFISPDGKTMHLVRSTESEFRQDGQMQKASVLPSINSVSCASRFRPVEHTISMKQVKMAHFVTHT